ncbi:hypothetical protein LZ30DRAFT_456941 [Colletotrichum cereale]|nr:hypothetical protein LZ30DRAFT_456941 [Colletotrichum cereale]
MNRVESSRETDVTSTTTETLQLACNNPTTQRLPYLGCGFCACANQTPLSSLYTPSYIRKLCNHPFTSGPRPGQIRRPVSPCSLDFGPSLKKRNWVPVGNTTIHGQRLPRPSELAPLLVIIGTPLSSIPRGCLVTPQAQNPRSFPDDSFARYSTSSPTRLTRAGRTQPAWPFKSRSSH